MGAVFPSTTSFVNERLGIAALRGDSRQRIANCDTRDLGVVRSFRCLFTSGDPRTWTCHPRRQYDRTVITIVGIDPGSRNCGYGVIRCAGPDASLTYVACGVLAAPATHVMESRLGEIARDLRELLNEYSPDAIAMEDVFSHVNPRSALALAQARGMALAIAGLAGLPVFSYAPALVKKTVVGSGRAEKEQVARMVATMLGLTKAMPLDASDALGVAITHGRTISTGSARITSSVSAASRGAS